MVDEILYNALKLKRVADDSALFSPEQEERIAEAYLTFPKTLGASGAGPLDSNRSNRLARAQYLAQYLSSRELEYFKLEREGLGELVKLAFGNLRPTREEFTGFVAAFDSCGSDTFGASEIRKALSQVLAPDRLALLEELKAPEYSAIQRFAAREGISGSEVSQLKLLHQQLSKKDPQEYFRQVGPIIRSESVVQRYLSDRVIHRRPRDP